VLRLITDETIISINAAAGTGRGVGGDVGQVEGVDDVDEMPR
jgi:hypothetical protein